MVVLVVDALRPRVSFAMAGGSKQQETGTSTSTGGGCRVCREIAPARLRNNGLATRVFLGPHASRGTTMLSSLYQLPRPPVRSVICCRPRNEIA